MLVKRSQLPEGISRDVCGNLGFDLSNLNLGSTLDDVDDRVDEDEGWALSFEEEHGSGKAKGFPVANLKVNHLKLCLDQYMYHVKADCG